MEKIYVDFFTVGNNSFKGEKNGHYYYLFPTSAEKQMEWVLYWLLVFKSKENFDARMKWEKVDADMIAGIKERTNEQWTWLWWMLFDNEEKKAFFISLFDNNMVAPGKEHAKTLVLKETDYREKPEA